MRVPSFSQVEHFVLRLILLILLVLGGLKLVREKARDTFQPYSSPVAPASRQPIETARSP